MNHSREEIEKILEEDVRPVLLEHSGNIHLIDIKVPNTIRISFDGACRFCPTAQDTMEKTVQATLRERLNDPDLNVSMISEVSEELLSMAKNILRRENNRH